MELRRDEVNVEFRSDFNIPGSPVRVLQQLPFERPYYSTSVFNRFKKLVKLTREENQSQKLFKACIKPLVQCQWTRVSVKVKKMTTRLWFFNYQGLLKNTNLEVM